MQQPDYSISTPENVDLHLELAGVGNRILAQLIDNLIQLVAITFIVIMALVGALAVYTTGMDNGQKAIGYSLIAALAILVIFFTAQLYYICLEAMWKGQTPGKRMAEIRVIEKDGKPIGWSASIFRNLVRNIDNIFCLGMLVMLIDKKERRLGDLAANTVVIRERKQEINSVIKLSIDTAAASALPLDIGRLSPAEYDLLNDFLRRRKSLTTKSRPLLASEMADHFRLVLDYPKNENAEMTDEALLETIYTSYRARALD